MAIILFSENGKYFSTDYYEWQAILQIAFDAGWSPEGTYGGIDKDKGEDGEHDLSDKEPPNRHGYINIDHCLVTQEDARNLAEGLTKACSFLKDYTIEFPYVYFPTIDEYHPVDIEKNTIMSFARFCENGSFRIGHHSSNEERESQERESEERERLEF